MTNWARRVLGFALPLLAAARVSAAESGPAFPTPGAAVAALTRAVRTCVQAAPRHSDGRELGADHSFSERWGTELELGGAVDFHDGALERARVGGRALYDWRELWEWGITETRLPLGSVIGFGVATFWELSRWQILGVITLGLIQTALIVLLLGNVVKRRRAERSLRESEERLSLATAAADVGVWMWEVAGDQVWATANWRRMFGFAPDAVLGLETVIQRIHPNDRANVIQTLKQALKGRGEYVSEYRIVRADGTRWIAAQGRVESATGPKRRRMLGASVDITERKRAEQAAHELSGRLISAQEEERARLAKELHDGLSQNLALLAVELELFGQRPSGALEEVSERMQEFSTRTKELSSEVHRLSHGLHPAKLEQLGLAAAIGGFCRELEAGGLICVKFSCQDVPRALPKDLALCLYRVTQEALQNVVKHSGARNATVELRKEANELQLRIADDGKGFDATAEPTDGLGLVSMRSRVRLVGGNIRWDSTPGQGTGVTVRAPVTVRVIERNSMSAPRARRRSSIPQLCARMTGCARSHAAAGIERLP